MNNYKEQNGCHNCKHAFVFKEYEQGDSLFCHLDKSERPLCGSVFMQECFSWDVIEKDDGCHENKKVTREERNLRNDAWDKWSEERKVEVWGICDKHCGVK